MKFKANFFLDWANMLENELRKDYGYDTSTIPIEKIPSIYFDVMRRRISIKKRTIELADCFSCPAELMQGWKTLKANILLGKDLNPYLSKNIRKIKAIDGLLNEWNVHHFHLGVNFNESDKFISRTKHLLFALISDTVIYVIGIFEHGNWFNEEIVEIIHKNWPKVIDPFKLNGITMNKGSITENQRKNIREKSVNVCTGLQDGTVYMPLTGGTNVAGGNIYDCMSIDSTRMQLKAMEKEVESLFYQYIDTFKSHGYAYNDDVEAVLEKNNEEYRVNFPKYGLSIDLINE